MQTQQRSVVRHVLRGASLALVTAALLYVLAPAGSSSDGGATTGQSSSSMADVYKGELTPLQRHAAFFDRDKDGVIHPSETYKGQSV